MLLNEFKKYLDFCYDQKNIKIIVEEDNDNLISILKKNQLDNIVKFNSSKKYSFKDIFIINDSKTLLKILNKESDYNFKIALLNIDENININLNKFDLLYKSSFLNKILHNSLTIYQRKKTYEERIQIWNEYYGYHLEKLYNDKKLDLIFYFGHKFISGIPKKNKVVVDFGCGSGYHAEFENLIEIDKYYFVDQNLETTEYLRNIKKFPNVILSNGKNIELDDNSIDYFICSHILEHIPNLNEVLENIYKKLKSDGSIILVAPCDPGYLWNLLTRFSPNRKRLKFLGLDYIEIMKYEHVNSFEKVKKELEKLFKVEYFKYFPFSFINNSNFNIMYFGLFKKR